MIISKIIKIIKMLIIHKQDIHVVVAADVVVVQVVILWNKVKETFTYFYSVGVFLLDYYDPYGMSPYYYGMYYGYGGRGYRGRGKLSWGKNDC
jgi:hypothetical protein